MDNMTLRAIICGALLGIAGVCSAADVTYTYTGNLFDSNEMTAEPARLVAHFVFDFDHSPQAADHIYALKQWDVVTAGMHFSEATPYFLRNLQFSFDRDMHVVNWLFSEAATADASGFLSVSSGFSYDGRAVDIAAGNVTSGPYASVYDKPGVWTESAAPVPEPANYLLLIAGLACMAGWRRRAGKYQAI